MVIWRCLSYKRFINKRSWKIEVGLNLLCIIWQQTIKFYDWTDWSYNSFESHYHFSTFLIFFNLHLLHLLFSQHHYLILLHLGDLWDWAIKNNNYWISTIYFNLDLSFVNLLICILPQYALQCLLILLAYQKVQLARKDVNWIWIHILHKYCSSFNSRNNFIWIWSIPLRKSNITFEIRYAPGQVAFLKQIQL